jgi:hypothetical protein
MNSDGYNAAENDCRVVFLRSAKTAIGKEKKMTNLKRSFLDNFSLKFYFHFSDKCSIVFVM